MKTLEKTSLNTILQSDSYSTIAWQNEIHDLNHTYGPAAIYVSSLKMGAEYFSRWHYVRFEKKDRRGEVVFAIQNDHERFLLHTKPFYPDQVYRLPSGGIKEDESVLDSLYREVFEETGFTPITIKLNSIIFYQFKHQQSSIPFSSYVFVVRVDGQHPQVQDEDENISGFEWIAMTRLQHVIEQLYNLPRPRWQDWGQMRAIAHEVLVRECKLNSVK